MLGASNKWMNEKMEGFRQYFWTCKYPGMWCHVTAQAVPDISKDQSAITVLGSVDPMTQCHIPGDLNLNWRHSFIFKINPLTPNDPYSGRTAPLTSKRCILYIYWTNIGTEYFKHGIYSSFFPLQKGVCFINLTYLVPVLFTFYIQDVLKLKKNSGAKSLSPIRIRLYSFQGNWPPAWVREDQVTTAHNPLTRLCL